MGKLASLLDKGFFRLARNSSLESKHRVKVGAVAVMHGKPVSATCNVGKSHPDFTVIERCDSIHVEIRAVLSANTSVEGGTVYVYRETAKGIPALSRPCNQCYRFMQKHGIRKVYYTTGEYPYWNLERIR